VRNHANIPLLRRHPFFAPSQVLFATWNKKIGFLLGQKYTSSDWIMVKSTLCEKWKEVMSGTIELSTG